MRKIDLSHVIIVDEHGLPLETERERYYRIRNHDILQQFITRRKHYGSDAQAMRKIGGEYGLSRESIRTIIKKFSDESQE